MYDDYTVSLILLKWYGEDGVRKHMHWGYTPMFQVLLYEPTTAVNKAIWEASPQENRPSSHLVYVMIVGIPILFN